MVLLSVETKMSINKEQRNSKQDYRTVFILHWEGCLCTRKHSLCLPLRWVGTRKKPGSAGEQTDAELREVEHPA